MIIAAAAVVYFFSQSKKVSAVPSNSSQPLSVNPSGLTVAGIAHADATDQWVGAITANQILNAPNAASALAIGNAALQAGSTQEAAILQQAMGANIQTPGGAKTLLYATGLNNAPSNPFYSSSVYPVVENGITLQNPAQETQLYNQWYLAQTIAPG